MHTNLDDSGEIIHWPSLVNNLKDKDLVPFLGAGASLGFNGSVGLPSGSELAQNLAHDCQYPGDDTSDFLRVAQYYETTIDRHQVKKLLDKKLSPPNVQPGEIHRILANWPIEVVLTTNYDTLMERAFTISGKDPSKKYINVVVIRKRLVMSLPWKNR